jgi:2-polyprenyl-6-methoxyphenol hydroxylase-like FAD-dependent oxidoreductase
LSLWLKSWAEAQACEGCLLVGAGRNELPSAAVVTGLRATALDQFHDRVVLCTEDEDRMSQQFSAKVAVGADGAHSTVHQLLAILASTSPTKVH